MLNNFDLSNHLIVITGASGFLGRWLIGRLSLHRTSVVAIDLKPFIYKRTNDVKGNFKFEFFAGNINNSKFLTNVFDRISRHEKKKTLLCHLSGLSHVGQCQTNPLMAYNVNVLQTVKVLEACRRAKITGVIYPSTGLVYGENGSEPFSEKDSVNPQSVYANTKIAAETAVHGYGTSFGFSCKIIRFSNIYGPDSHPDTAVNTALRQASKGQKIELKSLSPIRDFIYCTDAVEGLIRLIAKEDGPGCSVFNISTGIGVSIGKMIETLCRVIGRPDLMPILLEDDLFCKSKLILSNRKLVRKTGWQPMCRLEEGLFDAWKTIKPQEQ